MKKWIRMTALALAALLALAGCGKKQEPAGDRLAQIQQKGELVIALEGNWAPWSFHDDSDALVGYDVEVGKAIAEKLGVKATFVEGEWDGLLAGVEAGRYDMVINGVDITDSRKETYDFSTPYAYIKTALVVAKDNDTIQSFEDLAGKTTGQLHRQHLYGDGGSLRRCLLRRRHPGRDHPDGAPGPADAT